MEYSTLLPYLRQKKVPRKLTDVIFFLLLPNLHGFAILLNERFPLEGLEIGVEGLGWVWGNSRGMLGQTLGWTSMITKTGFLTYRFNTFSLRVWGEGFRV